MQAQDRGRYFHVSKKKKKKNLAVPSGERCVRQGKLEAKGRELSAMIEIPFNFLNFVRGGFGDARFFA